MVVKEQNAVLNLNLPKDLKEEFTKFAYALGTNPTNLLKMLMKNALVTRQVNLRVSPFDKNDWEIEPLDISDWGEDFIKKTEANTKELEKIFS